MGRTAIVIGASRGIGLGLAKELAGRGYRVFASERDHSEGLAEAAKDGDIEIVTVDVTDAASVAALAERIAPGTVDILVLNAGVFGPDSQGIADIEREALADVLMTNAVGPAQSAVTLLPLVKDGGRLALTTSQLGSIANSSGGMNYYRVSKVAQNMLARSLFEDHAKARGIPVLSLHPGWVQTDMGGSNAEIAVDESVAGLADVLEAERGAEHVFVDYAGDTLPW